MTNKHYELMHAAKVAIDRLAADESVEAETMIGSLKEVAEVVEEKIEEASDKPVKKRRPK